MIWAKRWCSREEQRTYKAARCLRYMRKWRMTVSNSCEIASDRQQQPRWKCAWENVPFTIRSSQNVICIKCRARRNNHIFFCFPFHSETYCDSSAQPSAKREPHQENSKWNKTSISPRWPQITSQSHLSTWRNSPHPSRHINPHRMRREQIPQLPIGRQDLSSPYSPLIFISQALRHEIILITKQYEGVFRYCIIAKDHEWRMSWKVGVASNRMFLQGRVYEIWGKVMLTACGRFKRQASSLSKSF